MLLNKFSAVGKTLPSTALHSRTVPDSQTASVISSQGSLAKRLRPLSKSLLISATCALFAPTLAVANLCENLISHKEEVVVPQVQKPPFRKYYREPVFRTKVMRITESREHGVFKPAYSTMQAWNADESYVLLYRSEKGNIGHYLFDGKTYDIIKALKILPSDLEDVFWSRNDPSSLYYSSKSAREHGRLYKYNVETDNRTLVKDFKSVCRGTMAAVGQDVQMHSINDDLFGFRCLNQRASEKKYTAFTYRISTDEIHTLDLGPGTDWNNWSAPMSGPSGERVYLQGRVLTPDLKQVIHKLDMGKVGEHGNIGLTHDGQDAVFAVAFNKAPNGCNGDADEGIGHVVEFNMETGKCRTVVGESDGYPYTTSSSHVSAQAIKMPGWVAVSSVGYPKQMPFHTNNKPADVFFSEIFLVNTDPDNKVVCRIAHHRSKGKLADNGDYPAYFGEPHVTISPSGTRVLFGSDWYDSGSVDTYVVELPSYQP